MTRRKEGQGTDLYSDQEVPRLSAMLANTAHGAQPERVAIVDARRDLDVNAAADGCAALATAPAGGVRQRGQGNHLMLCMQREVSVVWVILEVCNSWDTVEVNQGG